MCLLDMTTQLPLTLPLLPNYDKDSFVTGNANEQALGWLEGGGLAVASEGIEYIWTFR